MKKSFYQSKIACCGQIFIWILLAVLFIALFLINGDYSKDGAEVFIVSALLVELLASLCVPATMRKVVFSDSCLSIKIGPISLKKVYYKDIKYIDIFRKMSGPSPICYVFFSTKHLTVENVNTLFDKRGLVEKREIIFCDYPQKDLDELLKSLFPGLFDPNHSIVYSE